jgi:glycosidase
LDLRQRLIEHLASLYGEEAAAEELRPRLQAIMGRFQAEHPRLPNRLAEERISQRDTVLITYGDMVQESGMTPLGSLAQFLESHLAGLVSTVHILPFYPSSSDDGFSVIDYRQVDAQLGSWADIAAVGKQFRLMFDAVINHISAQSAWFQGFLRDEPRYRDYFTVVNPGTDLSQVFRPRALPLLTPVETAAGPKQVWTTFSEDQIDLNYSNPDVLLEVIETLLFYVGQGAELIRLDAIGFMWKEIGSSCIHRPQTHRIIQLMRQVLDVVAPSVILITETNVPHQENISYFGDGRNEAQMVYNFTLPPLTLHAFHTGNAAALSQWADTLILPSNRVTFFNFLASHDGIGLMPLKGLLSEATVQEMARRVEALGGHVSYRHIPDGGQSPYELNINYLDALGEPQEKADNKLVARRFLAAQAIMLALRGVPGIYFHSLFGSRNWTEGVQQTGRYRTINREKLTRLELEAELADPDSLRYQVFAGYQELLRARTGHPAFHPNGQQQVLFGPEAVFGLVRTAPDESASLLCLHNVSNRPQQYSLELATGGLAPAAALVDLIRGERYAVDARQAVQLTLPAYGVLWLAAG